MNKINKYLSLAAISMITASFAVSCDNSKDNDEFTMAPAADVPVYFENQSTNVLSIGNSDSSYSFNIYRNSLTAPSQATLNWSGDTQLFDLPTSVTFAEDALMSEITFTFNPQDFEAQKAYNISVSIDGYESTTVTQNEVAFQVTYFPMSDWAPFGLNEELGRDGMGAYTFANYYVGTENPVLVMYCYSLVNPDEMQFQFQWLIDNDSEADPTNPELWETFLTAESSDGGETLTVPEQVFAVDADYGNVYVSEAALYNPAASSGGSYFDSETGTFYLDVIAFVSDGYFGYGYETCVMNGYADTNDYSVYLSDLGSTKFNSDNYQLINISWTDAVSLVKYTIVDTESISVDDEIDETLIEALVKKVTNDEVSSSVANEQGIYNFMFPATGSFTIVAVTFKEENDGTLSQKSYAYLPFEYTSADPNAGWNSLGYVEYTDGYVCSLFSGVPPLTYYVELQESQEWEKYYRLVGPYDAAYPYNEPGDWNENVISYLYFDAYDPDCVYVDYSEQTFDWGSATLDVCWSLAGYYLSQGATPADVIAEGVNGTLKDGKVTFPLGSLAAYFNGNGPYNGFNSYEDEEGNESAPFCVDFNTLTDNPQSTAAYTLTRSDVLKKANPLAGKSAIKANSAKVVKYKANVTKVGKRQAAYKKVSNAPIIRK